MFSAVATIHDHAHQTTIHDGRPPRIAGSVLGAFCRDVHQPFRDVRVAVPHDLSHAPGLLADRGGLRGERIRSRRASGKHARRVAVGSHRAAAHDRARHLRDGDFRDDALRRRVAARDLRVQRARGAGERDVSPSGERAAGGHRACRAARTGLRGLPARGECGLCLRRGDRRRAGKLFDLLALRGRLADDCHLWLHRLPLAPARPARADEKRAVGARR